LEERGSFPDRVKIFLEDAEVVSQASHLERERFSGARSFQVYLIALTSLREKVGEVVPTETVQRDSLSI
jgi:hypothetical protein